MDPQIVSWIISLLSGAAGGNIAGALMKQLSLGKVVDSILGLLGGGLGKQLLTMAGVLGAAGAGGAEGGGLDLGAILGNVGSGGVGGAILMAVIGMIKKAMAKSA